MDSPPPKASFQFGRVTTKKQAAEVKQIMKDTYVWLKKEKPSDHRTIVHSIQKKSNIYVEEVTRRVIQQSYPEVEASHDLDKLEKLQLNISDFVRCVLAIKLNKKNNPSGNKYIFTLGSASGYKPRHTDPYKYVAYYGLEEGGGHDLFVEVFGIKDRQDNVYHVYDIRQAVGEQVVVEGKIRAILTVVFWLGVVIGVTSGVVLLTEKISSGWATGINFVAQVLRGFAIIPMLFQKTFNKIVDLYCEYLRKKED